MPRSTWERTGATLEFAAAELDRPLSRRDARTLALAEAGLPRRRRAAATRAGLRQDVRVLMTQRLADGAPMAAVAGALGVSERTLRRRLAAEGTSYQRLLDEVREALAIELLSRRSSLPLDVVAARLGYAGPTALIHAFRRWTGQTPRGWAAQRVAPASVRPGMPPRDR